MLTGEIRSQIDRIWDTFWSGGISNPLEVIEQITYLLFLKRLDELETAEELKLTREKNAAVKPFFPKGKDSKKRSYQDFRWRSSLATIGNAPWQTGHVQTMIFQRCWHPTARSEV